MSLCLHSTIKMIRKYFFTFSLDFSEIREVDGSGIRVGGRDRYGTLWYRIWYGTVRYGTVWYGMVRNGTVWYNMVRNGAVWYGMVRNGQYGTVCCVMVRYGTV